MNILFLNDTRGVGGGEIWVLRICKELKKNGHRCYIGSPENSFLQKNIEDAYVFTYNSMDSLDFSTLFKGFIKKNSIQIVLCTLLGNRLESWILNKICSTIESPPIIVFKLGLPPYPNYTLENYGYALHPSFRRLLTVCENNRQEFLNKFSNLSPTFVKVQYTGIDLDYFDPTANYDEELVRKELNIKKSTPLIVNISRISFLKGQSFLVQAATKFLAKFPKAHLLIVGDGAKEEIAKIKMIATGYDIKDRVHVWGFQKDIRPILAAATIYIQPSLMEGIPNALLEALAMKRPCIATDVGGVSELMDKKNEFILIPPNDIEAINKAVTLLLENKKLRKDIVLNSTRLISNFSIKKRAVELEKHLKECLLPETKFHLKKIVLPSIETRKKNVENIKSVLITQSEGMGDQIQSFPFLLATRLIFKNSFITLLIPESRKRLFKHFQLDEIIGINEQEAIDKRFEKRNFDLSFDLNLRLNLNITCHLNILQLVSFPKKKSPNNHLVYPLFGNIPLWRQFLGLLKSFGVYEIDLRWDDISPKIYKEESIIANQLLKVIPKGSIPIGISLGGFSTTDKHWGVSNFAKLINKLKINFPIFPIIFSHYREALLALQLEELIEGNSLNLANKYPNIGVLFSMLQRIDLHITNDNGVMHIADIMNTPQVVLFGPTNNIFFGPMGNNSELIISINKRMDGINFKKVENKCIKLLNSLGKT